LEDGLRLDVAGEGDAPFRVLRVEGRRGWMMADLLCQERELKQNKMDTQS